MDTKNIINFYISHKYKTILNIIFITIISFFIFNNLNLYSKKNKLIIYLGFNNFTNMFTVELGIKDLDPRAEFNKKIKSYKNYYLWTESLGSKKPKWNYKNFLDLKFEDDKILVVDDLEKKLTDEAIEEVVSYIEFTGGAVNNTFMYLKELSNLELEIEKNNSDCDKIIGLFLNENISRLLSKSLIEADIFDIQLKECLVNEYNDNNTLEKRYTYIMSKLLGNTNAQITESENNKLKTTYMEIYDIKKEYIYINNLKAINIYTFTIFLVLISLILQYGTLSFLIENKKQ